MYNLKKIAAIAVLPIALVLAGCSVQGSATPDPHVSAASSPSVAVQTDPLLKGFGTVITYKDGVSVSVSKPAAWTPDPDAAAIAGVTADKKTVLFSIVVTNNSKANLDLMSDSSVTSGGEQAKFVSDVANNIGLSPSTTLLPGQSITWKEGYAVKDPADITYKFTQGFDYASAIFDSKH